MTTLEEMSRNELIAEIQAIRKRVIDLECDSRRDSMRVMTRREWGGMG